jgi:hypothetical protein
MATYGQYHELNYGPTLFRAINQDEHRTTIVSLNNVMNQYRVRLYYTEDGFKAGADYFTSSYEDAVTNARKMAHIEEPRRM